MNSFIILSEKSWNSGLAKELAILTGENWVLISKKESFTKAKLDELGAKKIFIPHWSYIIPAEIFENFECIVFHMTDLPFGRGGSPLQNLIVRGYSETKISAIRVEKGLDTGDVYLKRSLSLEGNAQTIFERANHIVFKMILEIMKTNPIPKKQEGEIVSFKRRTPEMSSIEKLGEMEEIYDYIRMLDAEGYPKAFIETKSFKFEFDSVKKQKDNTLEANVRIIKK